MTRSPRREARPSVAWLLLAGLGMVVLGQAARPAAPAAQETQTPPPTLPSVPGGTADSNGRMIAVTGVDVTGQSVLYLIDTVDKQLAVYQASGGSDGTRGVELIGARKIDLDLKLDGFNDRTRNGGRPLPYTALEKMFEQQGLLDEE